MMLSRSLPRGFAFLFCLFAFTLSTIAQDLDNVTVTGTVTDSNGLVVVGATVTATSVETGVTRTVVTDDDGRYKIVQLRPGTYKIKVVQSGFGTQETPAIATIAAQNVQQDFTLSPADVRAETTVTVTGDDGPAVDTTRTIVGGTVTQREIEELPNVNRSPLDFIFTLGGTAEEPLSVRDAAEDRPFGTNTNLDPRTSPLESGIFSLSGGAAYSNNITIDGLDNNDDRLAQARFQPSIDAIAEVQVITNQFSAEYGRASGGRVNIRTRAGSKTFRGRAYLAYRNSDFNANTYNNNRRNLSRLRFTQYNPSFTFSGPIPIGYFNNKTFFFSAYEYDNFQDTTRIDTIVPVGQNSRLTLPAPTGGPERLERNSNFPNPAFTPALVAPYVNTVATPSIKNFFTQRLDHNFNNAHNITLNFEIGKNRSTRQFRTATNRLEDAILGPTESTRAVKFSDNYVFSSNVVNQFRFQYSIFTPNFASDNITDPVVLIALNDNTSIPLADQRNGTLTAGNSTFLANNFPSNREEKRFQFQETLNVIVGQHTFKFGADVQSIKSRYTDLSDATGTFNFASVRAFLDNRISQYRFNFGRTADQKNTYSGFFVQDEWQIKPSVTISFGLRYERESILDDNNNFGPRAAIAYSPFKNGKGVIRVGGGIFYNRVLLRTFDDSTLTESRLNYNTANLQGPSNANSDNCYVTTSADYNTPKCIVLRRFQFPGVPTLAEVRAIENGLPVGQSGFTNASNSLRIIDPTLKIPESYQFNVGFERDIGGGFVFESNYTYNKTIRLFREFNANAYNLPTGYLDYNDYLVRGNTNAAIRFVNDPVPAGNTTGIVGPVNGVTTVYLTTNNTSTAAGAPIGIARAQLQAQVGRRLNNSVNDNIDQVASIGSSLYNGITFEMRRRFRDFGMGFGGSFRAVYTLSKLIDDGLNNTTNAQTSADFVAERSRGIQDRRHRIAISGTFQMPKYLLGLNLSPIIRIGSSSPFNLGHGVDRNLNDNSNDRPDFTGNVADLRFRGPNTPYPQSLVNQLSFAPIGRSGNLPRNAGAGPKQFIFDMNISREIRFGESKDARYRLRPNVEFDNILNAKVFTFGSEFINLTPNAVNLDFLVPTRTLRPRAIRVGLRFDF